MKCLCVFLTLLFVISCQNEKKINKNEIQPEPKVLKVMSYNIHIANPPSQPNVTDVDAIVRVIQQEQPDLVALQEVDKFTERSGKQLNQAKAIAEKLGMDYYFAKATNRSNGEYGLAVLSKYPIKKSANYVLGAILKSELRTIGIVEVEIETGKKLFFATTHLDHLSTDENRQVQAKEMMVYLQEYSGSPIIIGGDFNMLPDNVVWYYIEKGFTKACKVCPNTAPSHNPTRAIDYFLLNDASLSVFSIEDYYVVDETEASDHLPIVMKLKY